jgi:hypothetical protein
MTKESRFTQSFKHKVVSCEYIKDMFWLGVKSGNTGKIYNVSIKIGDDCGWSGIKGIPNGVICSHMITALRYLVSKSAVEGMLKDKGKDVGMKK